MYFNVAIHNAVLTTISTTGTAQLSNYDVTRNGGCGWFETLLSVRHIILSQGAEGLFWTLTYDRGVRLRVMPIDGDSGFCAVFFDEA
eukprot:COSAG06_NODE_37692_length_432_cov_0.771772_1_plen_87_part_00